MVDWFRSWHGAPTDPKWLGIARKVGLAPGIVVSVAWALMDRASQSSERGSIEGYDADGISAFMGCEPEDVEAIVQAMADNGMLESGRFTKWEKHQPNREDTSTDRVRAFRERKKGERNAAETQMKRDETHGNAPDTDTDTDTESKKERGGANAQPEYAFSGRVIRLKAEDLARWRKAYHAVPDLLAEIEAADAYYADKPPPNGKWFFAASNWMKKAHQEAVARKSSGQNDDGIYAAVL